jgi:hypothetical protein
MRKSRLHTLSLYHNLTTVAAVAITGIGLYTSAPGSELFTNGSFEAGNSGFGTDLSYVDTPPFQVSGTYTITTNPAPWFGGWVSMGDHTTGSGLMLLTTPYAGSARIWYETVNVTVGTNYTFSGWAAHVSPGDPNIAKLSINAGSDSLGVFDLSVLPLGTWGQFSFNYTAASNGPVVFSITDLAISDIGNDFVLDDLSLVEVGAPTIKYQPQSQLGFWGKSASFQVTVSGTQPLSYQWSKGGNPIAGATSSSLVMTNLQMADAGSYLVVITNVYGSVTSNPAILTMNPAGVSIALYAGVTIDGVAGLTYGIQYTTDLSNTNSWQGLANVPLGAPSQLWFDVQPATQPKRYYRVVPGPISIP